MKKTVLHIITGLGQGGAETALYRLICSLNKTDFSIYVMTLQGSDFYSKKLEDLGVPVIFLNLTKLNWIVRIFTCCRIIKQIKPGVVQTWMYHADLFGGVCAKFCRVKKIIWGIRNDGQGLKLSTRLAKMICAALSWIIPQHIVANSQVGARNHIKSGYCMKKISVIANGFDCNYFTPQSQSQFLENILGKKIPSDHLIFGTLARFHRDKGYTQLLLAFEILCKHTKNFYLVLCGKGCNNQNMELNELLSRSMFADRILLINGTTEVTAYLNSLDVFLLPSLAEGFPNALGEAMLCELPCIATDVGDTAFMLKNTGMLVAANAHQQLAQACMNMINKSAEERKKMGEQARERIKKNFSLGSCVDKFISLY